MNMSQHSTKSNSTTNVANTATIDDVLQVGFFVGYTSDNHPPLTTMGEPNQPPKSSPTLLGDALNPIMLSQDGSSHCTHGTTTNEIFNSL